MSRLDEWLTSHGGSSAGAPTAATPPAPHRLSDWLSSHSAQDSAPAAATPSLAMAGAPESAPNADRWGDAALALASQGGMGGPVRYGTPAAPPVAPADPSLPGMTAAPGADAELGGLARILAYASATPSLSENLAGMASDRMLAMDPTTGRMQTKEDRRQERLGRQAERAARGGVVPGADLLTGLTDAQADALGLGRAKRQAAAGAAEMEALEAQGKAPGWGDIGKALAQRAADGDPELLGMLLSEFSDPIAIATMPIGNKGRLLARLAKLGAAGAAYEAGAAAAEQASTRGEVDDFGDIGVRAAGGAAGGVALELLFAGIGGLWRKVRAGERLSPDEQAIVAQATQSGLFEIGPDGEVKPSRALLESGLGEAPAPEATRGAGPVGPDFDPDAGLKTAAAAEGYSPVSFLSRELERARSTEGLPAGATPQPDVGGTGGASREALEPAGAGGTGGTGGASDLVFRFDEPGITPGRPSELPHGLYLTPGSVDSSPHADLGGPRSQWRKNPEARVLDLSDVDPAEITMREGALGASTGVAAARHFLGGEEFARLKALGREELIHELGPHLPDWSLHGYYDAQEVMEALGAELARRGGYDAIATKDSSNLGFDEWVALTDSALLPAGPPGAAGPGRQAPLGLDPDQGLSTAPGSGAGYTPRSFAPEVEANAKQAAADDRTLARAAKARERVLRGRKFNAEIDDLLTAIRKWGGLDTSVETDWQEYFKHLPRKGFGLGGVERKGGLLLDQLTEKAWQNGFIRSHDVAELEALLDRARTDEVWSLDKQDYADVMPRDEGPPPEPATEDWGTDADYEWLAPDDSRVPPPGGFVILTGSGDVVAAHPITLDNLKRLENEEKAAGEWFERERASSLDAIPVSPDGGRGPTSDTGRTAGLRQPERMDDQAGRRAGGPPEEGRPDLELVGQTPDEVRTQAAAAAKAKADEAAADAKARADAELDDFALSGSAAPVDEAEARGQKNLFDAPTPREPVPVTESPPGKSAIELDPDAPDAPLVRSPGAPPPSEKIKGIQGLLSSRSDDPGVEFTLRRRPIHDPESAKAEDAFDVTVGGRSDIVIVSRDSEELTGYGPWHADAFPRKRVLEAVATLRAHEDATRAATKAEPLLAPTPKPKPKPKKPADIVAASRKKRPGTKAGEAQRPWRQVIEDATADVTAARDAGVSAPHRPGQRAAWTSGNGWARGMLMYTGSEPGEFATTAKNLADTARQLRSELIAQHKRTGARRDAFPQYWYAAPGKAQSDWTPEPRWSPDAWWDAALEQFDATVARATRADAAPPAPAAPKPETDLYLPPAIAALRDTPKWARHHVPDAIGRASEPHGLGKSVDGSFTSTAYIGPLETVEAAAYELGRLQDGWLASAGMIAGRSKAKAATTSAMLEQWVDSERLARTIKAWREKNPDAAAAYDARQALVADLRAGDSVIVPRGKEGLGKAATIVRRNKKTLTVRYEDGQLDRFRPEALRSLDAEPPEVRDAWGEPWDSDAYRVESTRGEYGQLVPSRDNPWVARLQPRERKAFNAALKSHPSSTRLRADLKRLAGTPWEKQAVDSLLARKAIDDLVRGKTPTHSSALGSPSTKGLRDTLLRYGEDGARVYLQRLGVIGDASKPVNSIPGSFSNCSPSLECATYCYAAGGRSYPSTIAKAELVSRYIAHDPAGAAKMVSLEYRNTPEFYTHKALRMFDRGDGGPGHAQFFDALAKEKIRLQIFSKQPELLRQTSDFHLRLLSVDSSNMAMARANPDLPVAFIYAGVHQLPLLEELADRIQVILPVKLGTRVLTKPEINAIPKRLKPKVCPVDKGVVKVGAWNCTRCDHKGGVGCFHGSTTQKLLDLMTRSPTIKNAEDAINELRDSLGRLSGKQLQDVLTEVDKVLGDIRAGIDPGGEGRAAQLAPGQGARDRAVEVELRLPQAGPSKRASETPEVREGEEPRVAAQRGSQRALNLDLFDDHVIPAEPAAAATQLRDNFAAEYRQVPQGKVMSGVSTVHSAEEAAHVLRYLRKHANENMAALVLDADHNVLSVVRHTIGTSDGASVFPLRLIGAIANTPKSARVWLGHQHPGGVANPSRADMRMTERVTELLDASGITLEGHVVVARDGKYHHIAPNGIPETYSQKLTPRIPKRAVPITETLVRRLPPELRDVIESKDQVEMLARRVGTRNGLVLLDTRHQVNGVLTLTREEILSLRSGGTARRILEAIARTNASAGVVLADTFGGGQNLTKFLTRFRLKKDEFEFRVLDVVDTDPEFAGRKPFGTDGHGLEKSSGTFYANPFGLALSEAARSAIAAPGRTLAGGAAGGAAVAIFGADEDKPVFSPHWWLDVAGGAVAGVIGFQALRGLRVSGRDSFAASAFRRLSDNVNKSKLFGRGPAELVDIKRRQRVLQQMMDRQTAGVGAELLARFSPSERTQISDIIEGRGVTGAAQRVLAQAHALDAFLVDSGKRMQELGMLPEDMDIEGGYLHRYYAKNLGLDPAHREARGQSLSGSWSIRRGTTEAYGTEYLSPAARAIADQLESLDAERAAMAKKLSRLERQKPPKGKEGDGDWEDAQAEKIAKAGEALEELQEAAKDLRTQEVVEMTGLQDGQPRSFFFRSDEVGRVQPEVGAPAAQAHLDAPDSQGSLDPFGQAAAAGIEHLAHTDRVWTFDQVKSGQAHMHRDWTPAERKSWGEITDAGYRYVRGMAEASHDLSLATMFDSIARHATWTRSGKGEDPGKGWTRVPDTTVKGSRLRRYGALAGEYVRDDVWGGIQSYGRSVPLLGALGQANVPGLNVPVEVAYRHALSRWKLWKTVYNPVTHFNNTTSNVEMLYAAGYTGRDLVEGWQAMHGGESSESWRKARDAGLFGTTWTDSLLTEGGRDFEGLRGLADAMRAQPEIPDATLVHNFVMRAKEAWIESAEAVRDADGPWRTGLALAKAAGRPLVPGLKQAGRPVRAVTGAARRLYRYEDELFKMAAFLAETRKGATPDEAINRAELFFFDYQDLPHAVKVARDFPIGSPFLSYSWKAVPAVARTAIEHPELVVSLVMMFEAANYAGMMMEGMPQDRYWETMYGYEDDRGVEVPGEQDLLPPWDRGRSIWGGLKSVHIPGMPGYQLSLANAHAAGNPFAGEAGGRAMSVDIPGLAGYWGSDVLGSNPIRALFDIAVLNEDWRGKQIYNPEASSAEKTRKAAAYLYRAWAPSNALVPGGWHQDKILEGLAADAAQFPGGLAASVVDGANRFSESIGMGRYTGYDRMENEAETGIAVAGSLGVKVRAHRPEQSAQYQKWAGSSRLRDLGAWWSKRKREFAAKRITPAQFADAEAYYSEKKAEIKQETDRGPAAGAQALKEQGRTESSRKPTQ